MRPLILCCLLLMPLIAAAQWPSATVLTPCPNPKLPYKPLTVADQVPSVSPFRSHARTFELQAPERADETKPAIVLTPEPQAWSRFIEARLPRLVLEVPVAPDSVLRFHLLASTLMDDKWPGCHYTGSRLKPDGTLSREDQLALSCFRNSWSGILFLDGKTWELGNVPKTENQNPFEGAFILYRPLASAAPAPFHCAVTPEYSGQGLRKGDPASVMAQSHCKEVRVVAVVGVHNFAGNQSDAEEFVLALFNIVRFIFARERVNISLHAIDFPPLHRSFLGRSLP